MSHSLHRKRPRAGGDWLARPGAKVMNDPFTSSDARKKSFMTSEPPA
jgi:hypothetical protein